MERMNVAASAPAIINGYLSRKKQEKPKEENENEEPIKSGWKKEI